MNDLSGNRIAVGDAVSPRTGVTHIVDFLSELDDSVGTRCGRTKSIELMLVVRHPRKGDDLCKQCF